MAQASTATERAVFCFPVTLGAFRLGVLRPPGHRDAQRPAAAARAAPAAPRRLQRRARPITEISQDIVDRRLRPGPDDGGTVVPVADKD
jgi:hypothetical protein